MSNKSNSWRDEFNSQLEHGKHVLLYGNVEDRFMVQGENPRPVLLSQWLDDYFLSRQYELVVHYDPADGLQSASPETMDSLLLNLLDGQNSGARNSPGASSQNNSQTSQNAASHSGEYVLKSQRQTENINPIFIPQNKQTETNVSDVNTSPGNNPLRNHSRDPEEVIPELRRVVSQTNVPAAVILDFSDKYFDDPKRQSKPERQYLLHLRKVLTQSGVISQPESLRGRRNALIIVANKLADVPLWLYQDHPLLSLLRIPSPPDEERREFIEQFLPVITRGAVQDEKTRREFIQTFVEQTMGLTIWDLMTLGVIANKYESDPIDEVKEVKRLISLYRYGQKEDPWEKFNQGDKKDKIDEAREILQQRVKGQNYAVDAIVDMLVSATVGVSMSPSTAQSGKPKGVFFFVGPTGVGKTELAKAMAQLIFGDENQMRRFDMSEYSESHAAEKLTGAPPGYVGYEEGGQLTNYVREHPFSLILFDEIEKAHGQVMDKFLQILEDGRLTDSKGQTAYFAQSVIIFTSNIGADSLFSPQSGYMPGTPVTDSSPDYKEFVYRHFREKVSEHFIQTLKRPEILNRFGDNILVFDLLRPQFVKAIGQKFLKNLRESALDKRALRIQIDDSVLGLVEREMSKPENIKNGGRRIRTLLEDKLEKRLNRWIFENEPAPNTDVKIYVEGEEVFIEP